MVDALVGAALLAGLTQAEIKLNQVADVRFAQLVVGDEEARVSYDVAVAGKTEGNIDDFRERVAEILSDDRGWNRAGVEFKEVNKSGELHLVLAEPAEVEAAAPGGCSPKLSCTVGDTVYINDARWMHASDKYVAKGVSVKHYQEMVLNHEVGHFLGHGHEFSCNDMIGKSAIMIRRAEDVGNCVPSYWPLPHELDIRGLR